jgi:hypothetical protein
LHNIDDDTDDPVEGILQKIRRLPPAQHQRLFERLEGEDLGTWAVVPLDILVLASETCDGLLCRLTHHASRDHKITRWPRKGGTSKDVSD